MTEKEAAALDIQFDLLTPKVHKAKKEYDALVEQLAKLIEARHPERQEDVVKLFALFSLSIIPFLNMATSVN